ncbi:phosphatidylethanolamine-binding family protein [Mycobacterium intracellulare 1956]|uniref:Phosphatidylethanolamine-binding family protein n=1 Tax=Mycobacterium intracellulare 1956 TaxID=1299331 RepID=X8CTS7_MYCIT|nr:phosphatidylethanolamine-binding family protein [Mycobacterium intracellulare 1956]
MVGAAGCGPRRRRSRRLGRVVRPLGGDRNRPGPGSTAEGQTPAGATTLPNTAGQSAYQGPCPPNGTGTHRYRFTLYQLPNGYQLPGGLAGVQAAQTIAGAATAQAQLVGAFGG